MPPHLKRRHQIPLILRGHGVVRNRVIMDIGDVELLSEADIMAYLDIVVQDVGNLWFHGVGPLLVIDCVFVCAFE